MVDNLLHIQKITCRQQFITHYYSFLEFKVLLIASHYAKYHLAKNEEELSCILNFLHIFYRKFIPHSPNFSNISLPIASTPSYSIPSLLICP